MKICPKCGQATADDSDEFCTKCGAYYTDKQSVKQNASPMAAALGMMPPQAKPKAVPVPEGGTLKAGIDDMEAGNFPEGLAQWTSYVRENGQPSEDDYGLMVSTAAACILASSGDGQLHSRAGVSEFAMEVEGEFIQDLMTALIEGSSEDPVKAVSVSSEYMYLALESFSIYPDLRDVLDVLGRVPADIGGLMERCSPEAGTKPEAEMNIHIAFSKMISEAIRDAVVAAGDERMDALADYWSTKANLPYVNIVFNLSGLFAQVSMAKNVGKLTAKLLNKGISMQLEAFKNSYFNVKL